MPQQFLRSCSLAFSGGSGSLAPISGGGPADLKISFQIESHTLQSPDLAQFVISNPSAATAAAVQGSKKVSFSGGYAGSTGPIFDGDIVETQYGEKVDNFTTTLLRVWCANSDLAYNNARVNTSLAAGSSPMDMFNACLGALQPLGVSMGQIAGIDLSQPKFPRGIVMAGMARDYLREIALSAGATFTLTGGKLSMLAKNATLPTGSIVISAANGMLEQPILRPEGVIVKCLLNPQITVNSVVTVKAQIISPNIIGSPLLPNLTDQQTQLANQISSSGQYRVLHSLIDGDTRGGEWTMTLTTIGNGQPINTTQAGLGYS